MSPVSFSMVPGVCANRFSWHPEWNNEATVASPNLSAARHAPFTARGHGAARTQLPATSKGALAGSPPPIRSGQQ